MVESRDAALWALPLLRWKGPGEVLTKAVTPPHTMEDEERRAVGRTAALMANKRADIGNFMGGGWERRKGQGRSMNVVVDARALVRVWPNGCGTKKAKVVSLITHQH